MGYELVGARVTLGDNSAGVGAFGGGHGAHLTSAMMSAANGIENMSATVPGFIGTPLVCRRLLPGRYPRLARRMNDSGKYPNTS